MPQAPERLWTNWTDSELDNYDATIDGLRRIRSAAVYGLEPKTGLRLVLSGWKLSKLPAPQDRQQLLKDGEKLAQIAGNFLAKRVVLDERDKILMDEWNQSLAETFNQYGSYSTTTYARTRNMDVAISLLGRMRATYVDPNYMLRWGLFTENNVGVKSIDSLLKREITIIAPYSGDLLTAAFHQVHLQIVRGCSFPLASVALSKDLQHYVLPILEQPTELGIVLDVVQSGSTGRVLVDISLPKKGLNFNQLRDGPRFYCYYGPN